MKPPLVNGARFDFQTPPEAIIPLLEYIPKSSKIWECACGNGNLVKAFEERWYEVVATDLLTGHDFMMYEPEQYDVIVTNPPYDIKQEFLERAYSLGKPFAFLLPLTTFETGRRQDLFKRFGLEVIFFDKRINFEVPGKTGESGSWFATAWFTNGLNIGRQLSFVKFGKNGHIK